MNDFLENFLGIHPSEVWYYSLSEKHWYIPDRLLKFVFSILRILKFPNNSETFCFHFVCEANFFRYYPKLLNWVKKALFWSWPSQFCCIRQAGAGSRAVLSWEKLVSHKSVCSCRACCWAASLTLCHRRNDQLTASITASFLEFENQT